MKDRHYRPNIPKDRAYIQGISDLISQKEPLEDIHFEYLTDVLQGLGIAESPYDAIMVDDMKPESVSNILSESYAKLQKSLPDDLIEKLHRLWDYLQGENDLKKAGLIFVFGGPGLGRVDEAIRLYREGYASKILFTGQKASYMGTIDITEADQYAEIAMQAGIPQNDLILERESKNTPENAVYSVKILKELKFLPSSIILIAPPYHMRRAYLSLKTVIDWPVELIRHSCVSAYDRETYFHDQKGWEYVFSEYIKLYGARMMKHF